MTTILKILNAKQTIAEYQIENGATLTLNALDKVNYQLIDQATGLAPQQIIAKRVGNDLQILLENGDQVPDIIIQNYYADELSDSTNLLVGQHENGKVYTYVPTSGEQTDAISVLLNNQAEAQVLGGDDRDGAFWVFSPWWLLALAPVAAGIAIAAGSGGGSGGSSQTDNGLSSVADLVKDAEEKYEAAQQAVANADTDNNGLITEAEAQAAQEAIDAYTAAKEAAQEAVSALPESVQTEKEAFQARLDKLGELTAPAVTDDNANGIADTTDQALADATELVEKAEELEQAAKNAVDNADKDDDGLITPEEAQAVQDAIEAYEEAKAAAEEAVSGLPETVKDEKEGLQERLDSLGDYEVPAITDTNSNGIADTEENLLEELVKAAEDKYEAAQQAVANADTDNNDLITPEEAKAAQDAIDAYTEAKEAAQTAVSALPETVKDEKDAFQARLDKLGDLTAPAVTDENANGIADETDKALADATTLVEKAEELEQAAKNAVDNADKDGDGLITPEEAEAVKEAIEAYEAAKAEAEEAVSALPDTVKTEKDALQDRLDNLGDYEVPTVTDKNSNGIADTDENQATLVEGLVKAAEEKYATAQQAVANADTDNNGLITEAEAKAAQDAIDAYTEAKEAAQEAVSALPESVQTEKDAFQARLDNLGTLTAPEVTDDNANGIADETDQALADATTLVEKAEELEQAAKNAVDNADKDGDGLITPEEAQAVQEAIDAYEEAKAKAEEAVSDLPDTVKTEKDALQERLDNLGEYEAPEVTPDVTIAVDTTVAEDLQTTEAGKTDTAGDPSASGKLKALQGEEEAADASFAVASGSSLEGTYGTFTLNSDGNWSYTLDNERSATQALQEGEQAQDSLTVTTNKGGSYTLAVTVNGQDDAAVISGDTEGQATDGIGIDNSVGVANASGKLTASDVDNEDGWQAQTDQASDQGYGTFSIDADGNWSYRLDQTNEAVNQLIEAGRLDILPSSDSKKLVVSYTDQAGSNQTVTINKASDGSWSLDGSLPTGVSFESDTGRIDLAGVVQAGTSVTASSTVTKYEVDDEGTVSSSDEVVQSSFDTATNSTTSSSSSGASFMQSQLTDSFTVTTKGGDTQQVSVTINGQSAKVASIKLIDDFTDNYGNETDPHDPSVENSKVYSYYPEQSSANYVGEISSRADFSTMATGKATGLTNDVTPTLSFTLDKLLDSNQSLVVTRYKVGSELTGYALYDETVIDSSSLQTADNLTYSFTDQLEETYGQDYVYKVQVMDTVNGEQVESYSTEMKFRLDTMVESMSITKVDTNEKVIVFTPDGASEVGATITYSYDYNGTGTITKTATQGSDGNYTLDLDGWNIKSNEGVRITVVDAAGNVSESKVLSLRNLFSILTLEEGPDPNSSSFDKADILNIFTYQATTTAENGGFVATNESEQIILGWDNYGSMGTTNGSLARQGTGPNRNLDPRIETGGGDDFLYVRGTLQTLAGYTVSMGEGNDKLFINNNMLIGSYKFDLGDGNNIFKLGGYQVGAATAEYKFGSGNDLMDIGSNLDGTKTIDFGDGNNTLRVGGYVVSTTTITAGSGNDRIEIGDELGGFGTYSGNHNINLGDGNNSIFVKTTVDYATITTGSGDDILQIGTDTGADGANVFNLGDGNNQINIGDTVQNTSITTGTGDDYLKAGYLYTNSVVNTGAGDDIIEVTNNISKYYLNTSSSANPQIDMGEGDDRLLVGGSIRSEATIDMGSGNDIVIVVGAVGVALEAPRVNLGDGDDRITIGGDVGSRAIIDGGNGTDTLMITSNGKTDSISQFTNFEHIDLSGATNYELNLALSQLTLNNPDSGKTLYISGNGMSTVDFGDNSTTGTDTSGARATGSDITRFTDSSGYWAKSGSPVEQDGKTYDGYIYTTNSGVSDTGYIIYIEQGVNVI